MPIGPTPGGGGDVAVLSQSATLTDAQIKALPSTGVTIVPAPGEEKQLVFLLAATVGHYQAGYSGIDTIAHLAFRLGGVTYQGDVSASVVNDETLPGPIVGLTNYFAIESNTQVAFFPPRTTNLTGWGASVNLIGDQVNKPLSIYMTQDNGGSDLGGGDAGNSLDIIVLYTVLDLA